MDITQLDKTTQDKYFNYLEHLRQSGITNMWSASLFIEETFELSYDDARDIQVYWIQHYTELKERYGW